MTINNLTGGSLMMAVVADQEFRQMKKYMNDSCFTCTDEWLLACMNWIKENNRLVNFEVWKKELSEQWKDANLDEMESSCLPRNLSNQRVVKLPGKYGLQVNVVRDIGESSYSQWTKLKKLENENVSVAATDSTECTQTWQPTAKRCLHLTMTDGSQAIFGLEMQAIPGLNLAMKPGFKVIVIGPVDCRRGVLHLKPNNVRIIGGEVEDLFEANRVEKILADTLKLTSTSTSTRQTQQSTSHTVPNNTSNTSSRSRNLVESTGSREEVMGDFPDSEDPFADVGADGDDIFMEIDEEALLRSTTANAPTRSTSQMSTQKISTTFNQRSTSTTFTEDIEDFEDDPEFTTSRTAINVPSASNSLRSAPCIPNTSTSSSSTASSIRKPKPLFVPPIIPPSKTAKASTVVENNRFTVATPSTSSKIKLENSSVSTAFKSAKSALNTNSKGNSKQKNILQYMKPMPVTIDPPTPERQIIKRRRKSEEGKTETMTTISKMQQEVPTIKEEEFFAEDFLENSVNENVEPQEVANMEDDQDYVGNNSPPDESLLRIVDATLESRLLENDRYEASSTSSNADGFSKTVYPIIVPETPFIYLAQVLLKIDDLKQKREIVYVKACVSTIDSKLAVDKDCWTLCVCINDGTGHLSCKISVNILNGILGFTPAEMKELKSTKEGKQKVAEGMRKLQKELVHLNAVFAIEIGEQSMITEIIDLKLHHSAALKNRLFRLGV